MDTVEYINAPGGIYTLDHRTVNKLGLGFTLKTENLALFFNGDYPQYYVHKSGAVLLKYSGGFGSSLILAYYDPDKRKILFSHEYQTVHQIQNAISYWSMLTDSRYSDLDLKSFENICLDYLMLNDEI